VVRFKQAQSAKPSSMELHGDVAPLLEFRTKTEMAHEQLRRWIVSGRLAPGQRLDQEWLATELRVSRMPLRQALLRLEADGLIHNEPHRGAIVAPLSLAELTDVYAARGAIESMLAEAGTVRAGQTEFDLMAGAISAQDAAIAAGRLEWFVSADRIFHFTLYQASGYTHAVETANRLRDLADRYIWHYARYRSGAMQSVGEHRQILANCRQGRATEVRHLTQHHVDQGQAVLAQLVGNG
jgi:DNA-binding GntR family transcriptional regulator